MNEFRKNAGRNKRIIGLVPAAGQANRLSPLPFSKELYPIGYMRHKGSDELRPKPVCMYLLEKMKIAGIKDVFIVLRKGKWDIPGYLGDGSLLDMNFAYLMMNLPFGVPYTLNQALPFTRDAIVAFGYPDVIFQPDDAFVSLLEKQSITNADVVLGLFSTHQPHKTDMIDLDTDGCVRGIQIRPARTHLRYSWIIAVWTSVFTQFMKEYLGRILDADEKLENGGNSLNSHELYVGHVFQAAIGNHLRIEAVTFPDDTYLDIGTYDNLFRAIRTDTLNALQTNNESVVSG